MTRGGRGPFLNSALGALAQFRAVALDRRLRHGQQRWPADLSPLCAAAPHRRPALPRPAPIELPDAEAARIERLTRTAKPGSSPAPASPSTSAGHTGDGATTPAPAGITTAPASRPFQPYP